MSNPNRKGAVSPAKMQASSSIWAMALLWATLFLAPGCAGNTALNDPCGNPCATMSCPEHTHCSVSGSCASRCEADYPSK